MHEQVCTATFLWSAFIYQNMFSTYFCEVSNIVVAMLTMLTVSRVSSVSVSIVILVS